MKLINEFLPYLLLIKIAQVLGTSIEGLFSDSTIAKYYELSLEDKETINRMIESLYEKK